MDNPAHLQNSRVWLFSGKADQVVKTPAMEAVRAYYGFYLRDDRIAWRDDLDAGHAMLTETYGGTCAYSGPPFVTDCDFDAAGALLSHIYGPLNSPGAAPEGRYIDFDQKEFLPTTAPNTTRRAGRRFGRSGEWWRGLPRGAGSTLTEWAPAIPAADAPGPCRAGAALPNYRRLIARPDVPLA